jgi:Protein of unknown function (DUF3572)
MKAARRVTKDVAEALAIQALSYLAGDGERLGRFLAVTGIGPEEIRSAAVEPGFLVGVLEYLASDEPLLSGFAAEVGINPTDIAKAHAALGGQPWEREVP